MKPNFKTDLEWNTDVQKEQFNLLISIHVASWGNFYIYFCYILINLNFHIIW